MHQTCGLHFPRAVLLSHINRNALWKEKTREMFGIYNAYFCHQKTHGVKATSWTYPGLFTILVICLWPYGCVGKFPLTLIGAGFVLKSEPDFL